MGEILGIGCTHRPLMLRPDENWTFMMRAALDDPAMPQEMKNPANWPAPLREELGNDWGASTAARYREVYRRHFAEARRALDDFKPDLIVMWGDDQYENFKEDIVPPFCVLAYDDQDIQPWAAPPLAVEPVERAGGQDDYACAAIARPANTSRPALIEAGIDIAYSYKPLHHPMGHAFENTVLLLDDERRGFDYPVVQFAVNCYGRRVNAARGLRLPLAMKDDIRNLDPPGPNPHRCMEVGAATARVMAESPWRMALMASSSWSHSFLTEKNWQLWPDVAADRRLYDALETGDYATWHGYTTDQIEECGEHEVLNWFCLLGAMEALGRTPDKAVFLETWAFVSPVVFAHYHA